MRPSGDSRKLLANDTSFKFCVKKQPTKTKRNPVADSTSQPSRKKERKYERLARVSFRLRKDEFESLNEDAKVDSVEIYGEKPERFSVSKLLGVRSTMTLVVGHSILLGGEMAKDTPETNAEKDLSVVKLQVGREGHIKFTPANPQKYGYYRRHISKEEMSAHAKKVNCVVGWCEERQSGVLIVKKSIKANTMVYTGSFCLSDVPAMKMLDDLLNK